MERVSQFSVLTRDDIEFVLDEPTTNTFRATLITPAIRATVACSHIGGDFLGKFFGEIARDWRGWEGVRHWHSIEYQLNFEATHTKTGRINLRIVLRDSSRDAWEVRVDDSL